MGTCSRRMMTRPSDFCPSILAEWWFIATCFAPPRAIWTSALIDVEGSSHSSSDERGLNQIGRHEATGRRRACTAREKFKYTIAQAQQEQRSGQHQPQVQAYRRPIRYETREAENPRREDGHNGVRPRRCTGRVLAKIDAGSMRRVRAGV